MICKSHSTGQKMCGGTSVLKCSATACSSIAVLLVAITVVTAHTNYVNKPVENCSEVDSEPDRDQMFLPAVWNSIASEARNQNIANPIQSLATIKNTSLTNKRNNSSTDCRNTWTYLTENGSCECGDTLNGAIQCNISSHHLAIHTCYCMTYDESTERTVVGPCLYSCVSPQVYRTLPLNVSQLNTRMCGHLHRTGQLCGQCEEGYKQPAYFYGSKCVICNSTTLHNRLKYIAIAFIPLTFFLLIILCFRISATSAKLNAFVLFSHTVSAPPMVIAVLSAVQSWPKVVVQVGATLYGIWNLDFLHTLFSDICLDLSSLQVLALDYAIAFYPLLLMIIFYVLIELHDSNCRPIVYMWKPFSRCLSHFRRQWNARASTVDAFVTCLLLSYTKLLSVSADLLVPVWVYDLRNQTSRISLYYDTTIGYLNKEHLPYAILALVVLFFFILAPLLLLILYPMECFQRCLGHFRVRWHAVHIFADSFQGCYKDGTNGTRDCRYFAAMYLLVRIIMNIIFESLVNSIIVLFWESIAVFFFSISIAVAQPYKPRYRIFNTIDTVLTLLLAVWLMTSFAVAAINTTTAVDFFVKRAALFGLSIIIGVLPLIYLLCITFQWLCCRATLCDKCFSKTLLQRRTSEDSLPDRMVNPDRYSEESLYDPVANGHDCSR